MKHFVDGCVDKLTDDGAVLCKMVVELLKEGIIEYLVNVEEKGNHCLVTNVYHKSICLHFASLFVVEVDHWCVVLHGAASVAFFGKVVWSNNEAVEGL